MQFLKILFWCLLAFVAAVFTLGNWRTVPINLWGGLIAEVNLPLLLLITFLVGLVPTLLFHHAVRWRLRNRLATSERTVTDLRATLAPPPALVPVSAITADPGVEPVIAPAAEPVLPPPGAL